MDEPSLYNTTAKCASGLDQSFQNSALLKQINLLYEAPRGGEGD